MVIERILSKLFRTEEINGHGICPTYLYRWIVLHRDTCSVYVHKFVGDDWSKDLHDHPKHFWTIGLWGMYREQYWPGEPWSNSAVCVRDFHAPWFRHFPPEHRHRLMVHKPCWTLVFVGSHQREWGFWWPISRFGPHIFFPWRDYVGNPEITEGAKTCP